MHIDLCVELNDDEISPEFLAEKVHEFEASLGGSEAIRMMEYEVTPLVPASEFAAAYLDKGGIATKSDESG